MFYNGQCQFLPKYSFQICIDSCLFFLLSFDRWSLEWPIENSWFLTETMYSYVFVWKSFAFFFFLQWWVFQFKRTVYFHLFESSFFFFIAQQFLFFSYVDLFHGGYSHYVFFFFLISGPFSLWLWPFSSWPSVDLSHYGYCLFDSSVKVFFFFFFISGPLLLWLFATVLYFTHCKWFPIDVLLYFKWYIPNEPHLVVSFLSVL